MLGVRSEGPEAIVVREPSASENEIAQVHTSALEVAPCGPGGQIALCRYPHRAVADALQALEGVTAVGGEVQS